MLFAPVIWFQALTYFLASEKCQQEKRKTVNGEDILFAMTSLGFENYAEALKIYLSKYREVSRTLSFAFSVLISSRLNPQGGRTRTGQRAVTVPVDLWVVQFWRRKVHVRGHQVLQGPLVMLVTMRIPS